MWIVPDILLPMLQKYEDNPLIGEILIVNNKQGFLSNQLDSYKKVRILNDGNNLYVNPAWNLGVSKAVYDKIIIANDDIYIEELDVALQLMDLCIKEGMIFGFGRNCFLQKRGKMPLGHPKIVEPIREMVYGFGVFMLLYKSSYVKIPEPLKVWCGDSFLYNKLKPYIIEGIDVVTRMRETTRTMNLKQVKIKDQLYYFNNIKNWLES